MYSYLDISSVLKKVLFSTASDIVVPNEVALAAIPVEYNTPPAVNNTGAAGGKTKDPIKQAAEAK